jgi:hypothetical protein
MYLIDIMILAAARMNRYSIIKESFANKVLITSYGCLRFCYHNSGHFSSIFNSPFFGYRIWFLHTVQISFCLDL